MAVEGQQQDEMRVGTAFLQGACVGALLALIFAPSSGQEFRTQMKKQAVQGRDKLRRWAEEGNETMNQTIEKGKEVAHNAQRKVSAMAESRRSGGQANGGMNPGQANTDMQNESA